MQYISLKQSHHITAFFTDLYQFTTSYSYFLCNKHEDLAVFECFFRKNPFKGEYTILGGIRELLAFVNNFKITQQEIDALQTVFPQMKQEYFSWLKQLTCKNLQIQTFKQGQIVFPNEPLVILSGPLSLLQILETPLLNLIGFASLVATNASRMVTASNGKSCVEFGIRRAQGPDGGLSASHYSYLGGFVGTSNCEAYRLFGIKCIGTMSHAYVTSFSNLSEAEEFQINGIKIVETASNIRKKLGFQKTHDGQLAAFLMYARAFRDTVVTLVDTYNTMDSGLKNSIVVAMALNQAGITSFGIRLDSGDLQDTAKKCRAQWNKYIPNKLNIIASNDLNQELLLEIEKKGSQIDTYAIGTNIATCQKQPALGLVYKLAEFRGDPTMKFSEQKQKITLPGKKNIYRVWTQKSGNKAAFDLLTLANEELKDGDSLTVVTPGNGLSRFNVQIKKVERLNNLVWDGKLLQEMPDLHKAREFYHSRRKELKEEIFFLTGSKKHSVLMSLAFFKKFEETLEKNIIIKDLE